MVLGSFSKKYRHRSLMHLLLLNACLQCVYKLETSRRYYWDDHVATVVSKAAKRLWFLKKLKRASVSVDDLVHYYLLPVCYPTSTRICIAYRYAVWHPAVTKEQTQSLENIQRRALQIIFGNSSCDFSNNCRYCVIGVATCASHCSDK